METEDEKWFRLLTVRSTRIPEEYDPVLYMARDQYAELSHAISAERALREKRERQMVWMAKHVRRYDMDGILYDMEDRPMYEQGKFIHHDGTPAGLIAAIDEATADLE